MYKTLLLISLSFPLVITFLLWPSKRNIVFIQSLPFYLLAYVGGSIFLFDEAIKKYNISQDTISYLCFIMLIGNFFYSLSFYVGFKGRVKIKSFLRVKIGKFVSYFRVLGSRYYLRLKVIIFLLSVVTIILYVYSYRKMGFVPMFADNPLVAKYFAGTYQERYRPVAKFFRLALNLSTIVVPFLVIFIFLSKRLLSRFIFFALFLGVLVLTFLSLRRGIVAFPIIHLLLLFFIYYKEGRYMIPIALVYVLIFAFGSSFNDILMIILGLKDKFDIFSVLKGVPDVSDLLWFWDSFIKTNYEFSFGRTIYGGLIPYHYDWNPAVVTKLVIGASKNAPTGGFRLPFQVEGYIAFGLIGTIIWSIYYGFINGLYLKLIRYIVYNVKGDFVVFYMAIFLVNLMYSIFKFFIKMQIDNMVVIIISLCIIFLVSKDEIYKNMFCQGVE